MTPITLNEMAPKLATMAEPERDAFRNGVRWREGIESADASASQAFEAWARGPAGYVDDQLAKYADGTYQDSTTRLHWSIWQAAWKASHGPCRVRSCDWCAGTGKVMGEPCEVCEGVRHG